VSGAVAALGDTLFPAESLAEALREDLSPSSHIFLRLRLWHPVIAILGSGYLIWLVALLFRGGSGARALALALGALSLIQIAVGFVNVVLLAPIWLQLTHLLIADAIWIMLVTLALSSQPFISSANLAT
jgi:heme A synthase